MCTVVFRFDPSNDYSFRLIGNRDELRSRSALAPKQHWNDRPGVIGGLDEQAGGTWMVVNEAGVFSTLLNARQTLGPANGKRSRGEIPLDAMDFENAADAVEALETLEPSAYRAFNLIVADPSAVFLVQNDEANLRTTRISPGLYMISHSDLNDPSDPRIRWFLDAFQRTTAPENPAKFEHWTPWIQLMNSKEGEDPKNPLTALTIKTSFGFETRCTALIGLSEDKPCVWWHRDGQEGDDDLSPFHNVLA